jgi:hypothetical protein
LIERANGPNTSKSLPSRIFLVPYLPDLPAIRLRPADGKFQEG